MVIERILLYYRLAKPGIIYGNILAAIAGFLLASKGAIIWETFLGFTLGLGFVIGSACVSNNIIDRSIDKKMSRTKNRALVTGDISPTHAAWYAVVLAAAGFGLLIMGTNWLTVGLAALAFFLYVVVYGAAKRKTIHGTLVGAIPGAIPPAAGYVAVSNNFDLAALLLFLVMVAWQMPHFYAIAMYRKKEYAAAALPVLPIVHGNDIAKRHIFFYIVAFIAGSLLLTYFGYTDITFAVAILVMGFLWLVKARRGFKAKNDEMWAKGMFLFSLKVLLLFCLLLSVEAWIG